MNRQNEIKHTMLPVYKALTVDIDGIHSGSTKPCIMTLADNKGNLIGQYVVKVFKPTNLEQSQNTNKEVYGSVLATEFDFATPTPALAQVGQMIIDQLNKSEKFKGFNLIKGTYFATEYLENVFDYSIATKPPLENWEIENIFAFDVLIRNVDRHKGKPNLFFRNREVHLIDHELSFAIGLLDKPFKEMLKDQGKYWNFIEVKRANGFERKHLFLDYLRGQNKTKDVEFATFAEYLNRFDVDVLDSYQKQLRDLGNDTEGYYSIKSYLNEIKSNPQAFIDLLKDLIT